MSPTLSFWCPVHAGLRQRIARIIAQLVHCFGMRFLGCFGNIDATRLYELLCILPDGCAWLSAHKMPMEFSPLYVSLQRKQKRIEMWLHSHDPLTGGTSSVSSAHAVEPLRNIWKRWEASHCHGHPQHLTALHEADEPQHHEQRERPGASLGT